MAKGINISLSIIPELDVWWGDEESKDWLEQMIIHHTSGIFIGGDLGDIMGGEVTVNSLAFWGDDE